MKESREKGSGSSTYNLVIPGKKKIWKLWEEAHKEKVSFKGRKEGIGTTLGNWVVNTGYVKKYKKNPAKSFI